MIAGFLSTSVLFFHVSSALMVRKASASASSSSLGTTTTIYAGNALATGFAVTRDNGGGATLNGHIVLVLRDTQTPSDGPTVYSW